MAWDIASWQTHGTFKNLEGKDQGLLEGRGGSKMMQCKSGIGGLSSMGGFRGTLGRKAGIKMLLVIGNGQSQSLLLPRKALKDGSNNKG